MDNPWYDANPGHKYGNISIDVQVALDPFWVEINPLHLGGIISPDKAEVAVSENLNIIFIL